MGPLLTRLGIPMANGISAAHDTSILPLVPFPCGVSAATSSDAKWRVAKAEDPPARRPAITTLITPATVLWQTQGVIDVQTGLRHSWQIRLSLVYEDARRICPRRTGRPHIMG